MSRPKTNAERKANKLPSAPLRRVTPPVGPQPCQLTINFPDEATRARWVADLNKFFAADPEHQIHP